MTATTLKKFNLTFLLILTLFTIAVGQVRISVCGIAGSYAMSDMHGLQDNFVQQEQRGGFSVIASKSFPITPQAELGIDFATRKKGYWGSFFNYAGTKGVAGYGSSPWLIQSQQILTRYLLGVKRYQQISKDFYFVGKAGMGLSTLSNETIVDINSNNQSESRSDLHSWGAAIQPGFSWIHSSKNVGFEVSFGYEINFPGKTSYNNNSKYYLINTSGQPAKIDWSGFRIGVGLTFSKK